MHLIKLTSLILAVFTLQSCKCQKETSNMQDNTQEENQAELLSGTYTISLIGTNRNFLDNLSISFDDAAKKVSGFAGCNRFFGTYSTESNAIKFGELASTKMYCEGMMEVEDQLLKALVQVSTFSVKDNQLNLRNNDSILVEASKDLSEEKQSTETYAFEYSALSRGLYKQIEINKKIISITNARGNSPVTKSCSESNWESILKTLKPVDVKNITTLKAPSEKRFYDGAAIANLTIIYNGKTYKTEPFDHGNPPKEIAELVKEILSISENIE